MDKKRSVLNVGVSIAFKVMLLIGRLLVMRFLNKINTGIVGVNEVYTSTLGILTVAELGVGSAITFGMYKPIVEGENDKVSALYHLFTKWYLIIGAVITVAGFAVMPLMPMIANDYKSAGLTETTLYLTFGLYLISVVITYLFSSKTSLINAYKNNYVTTAISSAGLLLQYVLQVIVLICTKSVVWFFVCQIITVFLQWGVTELICRLKHKQIIVNKQKVDGETKKELVKNIKAMFMHKIGQRLVNTADSLIIGIILGVTVLGGYSNYLTIMSGMVGVISLFFTPLTSVIGHLFVEESCDHVRKYYNFFYAFNFILGSLFFFGYYAIIDNLIIILVGESKLVVKAVSFVITLNYFIQFMRKSTELFKDASGTFYYDRWKPLVEGIVNILLSVGFVYLFAYWFGKEYAVTGVIAATVITNLTICHVVEPFVLYKHALLCSPKKYYITNYLNILLFTGLLVLLDLCLQSLDNNWAELVANGFIAVAFAVIPLIVTLVFNRDFRHYGLSFVNKIKRKFVHKKKEND